MPFELSFSRSADREFNRMPEWAQRRFNIGFNLLREAPHREVPGLLDIHQLRGGQGLWTMRVGPFRGVYKVLGTEIVVLAFRGRDTIYRDLEHFER